MKHQVEPDPFCTAFLDTSDWIVLSDWMIWTWEPKFTRGNGEVVGGCWKEHWPITIRGTSRAVAVKKAPVVLRGSPWGPGKMRWKVGAEPIRVWRAPRPSEEAYL